MSNFFIRAFIATCGLLLGAVALGQASAPKSAPQSVNKAANDYSKPETWLCRPGRKDACAVDLSSTVVAADGKLSKEGFTSNPQAPIDCFYVYPTVSADPTSNSDMSAGIEEQSVVRGQFARFGSQCKLYAPLYRQITLKALRAALAGDGTMQPDRLLSYNDVLAAWRYYLDNDNKGRGVVLIGHSQGAAVLKQLIRDEIDGKPVQSRVLSAMLLGVNITVPAGKEVGGSFQHLPLCRSGSQLGCVISYVSFRADAPPPANSPFGRFPAAGMTVACSNPAALSGGKAELHAYFSASADGVSITAAPTKPWVSTGQTIDTPFVSVPGLLTAECAESDGASYLAITTHANPADPRTDEIPGDLVRNGQLMKDWGLHLIDVHVAIGNLVEIVGQQSQAYLKR